MADLPDVSVLRRNAEWADTFGGASTNLAQRQRYAADQERYAESLLEQQEQTALNMAMRDQTAQNFYFRQKELARKGEMDRFNMDLRDRKARWDDELMPLKMETERARFAATQATEAARLNKERRDAESALRVVKDTDAFEDGVSKLLSADRVGSETFARGVLDLTARHPYIPADLRRTWMQQADIDGDPDTLMSETAKFSDGYDRTLSRGANGKWTIRMEPKKAVAEKEAKADTFEKLVRDTKAAKEAYGTNPIPVSVQKSLEDRGRLLERPATPTTQAPAPTVAANNPNQAAVELTTKAEFDALPSGSIYVRNGKRFKKP